MIYDLYEGDVPGVPAGFYNVVLPLNADGTIDETGYAKLEPVEPNSDTADVNDYVPTGASEIILNDDQETALEGFTHCQVRL